MLPYQPSRLSVIAVLSSLPSHKVYNAWLGNKLCCIGVARCSLGWKIHFFQTVYNTKDLHEKPLCVTTLLTTQNALTQNNIYIETTFLWSGTMFLCHRSFISFHDDLPQLLPYLGLLVCQIPPLTVSQFSAGMKEHEPGSCSVRFHSQTEHMWVSVIKA